MFGEVPSEARRRYVEVVDEATELVRERREGAGKSVWRALAPIETHVLRDERVSG